MRFRIIGGIAGLTVIYLLFWPVPIDPVAWDAPQNAGLVDPFAPNDRLKSAITIDLGEHAGPEVVAGDRNGLDGNFWVGLVAPRNQLVDDLSDKPFIRKMVQRLPAFVRPKAEPSSHVISISGDGEVLMNLQDTAAMVPSLTGVYETKDSLWLTSLFGNKLAQLSKADLHR